MHKKRLGLLVILWLMAAAFFMLYEAKGSWSFLFAYRMEKLLALTLVGCAVSVSTIVFQSITHNRILTPSIMGLDALYLLISISAIAILGAQAYVQLNEISLFFATLCLLMLASTFVFIILLKRFSEELFRLLLIGVILGVLCRSLTEFISRILSPEDFAVYQGAAFAQFNHFNSSLLWICCPLMGLIFLLLWRFRFTLDVLALGRIHAINLGVAYFPAISLLMMLIAALVSLSTALVGPVLFLGLLVSALVYQLFPNAKHHYLLFSSALLGSLILIAGQAVFERVFGLAATLSVIIELFGGLAFIVLLLKRKKA